MEKFDLHILGCGSALPTNKHLPTSQVLNLRDKLFMIDCAEGTQLQLRRLKLKFSRLNHIFLSHLHGDHCFGLPGLLSTFDLLGRVSKLHIYSPGDDLERLLSPWLSFFCRSMSYEVVFHALDYQHDAVIYEDRSLTVESFPLRHRVPCCGFLFREKPTLPHIRRDMADYLHIPFHALSAIKSGSGWTDEEGCEWPHERLVLPASPGRTYAYCSDTLYTPELAKRLHGVDLLFHEATFADDAERRARATHHTTARQAATLARQAEVRRLVLGHFSARYENEQVLLDEALSVFPNTILANEGLKISL